MMNDAYTVTNASFRVLSSTLFASSFTRVINDRHHNVRHDFQYTLAIVATDKSFHRIG